MDERRSSQATTEAAVPDSALLKAAVEAVADAVIVTMPELDLPGPVIVYVNPAFIAMTGYAADEVIGCSPRLLHGPATDRAVLDQLRAELGAGGPSKGELVNYRKDGSEYYVEWLISALRDDAGQVRYWVSAQRDVTARRHMEERQAVLIAELQHRTRNLLAVVQALADETLQSSDTLEGFQQQFSGQLSALSRVQGLLSRSGQDPITLDALLRMELDALGGKVNDRRLTLDGPEVRLRKSTVQTLALALHELATNARKYGALAVEGGRLRVTWQVQEADSQERRLRLEWIEEGPLVRNGQNALPVGIGGYGRQLIEQALPYALGARTNYVLDDAGVRCTIDLPLASGT